MIIKFFQYLLYLMAKKSKVPSAAGLLVVDN